VAALGKPLTAVAQAFGPADYFSLMVLGLVCAIVLASGSVLKAIAMIFLGLLLSTIGTDLETGEQRMTFGFLPLALAMRGVAGALPFHAEPDRPVTDWGSNLKAEATRFRKR
jgi:TctA family transporter